MLETDCKFTLGQLVHHERFGYRGVVIDMDPNFQGTDEWYDTMAKSLPPKDKPWYHVLVDIKDRDGAQTTYVSERNLGPDDSPKPIEHPLIRQFFTGFRDGGYVVQLS